MKSQIFAFFVFLMFFCVVQAKIRLNVFKKHPQGSHHRENHMRNNTSNCSHEHNENRKHIKKWFEDSFHEFNGTFDNNTHHGHHLEKNFETEFFQKVRKFKGKQPGGQKNSGSQQGQRTQQNENSNDEQGQRPQRGGNSNNQQEGQKTQQNENSNDQQGQ